MPKYEVKKQSEITVGIGLDAENHPVTMEWSASDNPAGTTPQPCKAMLLSLFTEEQKETLKIDLWTRDMQVMEMDRFFYQTLRSMADTYFRATGNKELADQFQRFVYYFGSEVGAVPKQGDVK